MNTLLNKWYKNHALVYKILLFFVTTLFIVYLFPKTGKFRYSFEKGKPWQSENLYAPFNFAIKKSPKEIESEQNEIKNNSPVYFEINTDIEDEVLIDYNKLFNKTFKDSNYVRNRYASLFKEGKSLINKLYAQGVLDLDYNYPDDKTVILASSNKIKKEIKYGELIELNELRQLVEEHLKNSISADKQIRMLSIFFDVIKPNVKLNKNLTQKVLEEELSNISLTRGNIEKDQLIVTKGQVVEKDQYDILDSLKSEYESHVWNSTNYNWVLVAYTLLVALALLMLLLFLRKYRLYFSILL